MATNVGARHTLSALRSGICRPLQLLSRVESEFEPTREVAFQIARTVEILSLVECDLLKDIVFAGNSLFLLKQ